MATEFAAVNDAQVLRDTKLTWRWYDAWGPNVVKWVEDFVYWNTDDTTGDPTAYTMTVVEAGAGDSTAVLTPAAGGALLMTAAANENDGVQIQAKLGEQFKFDAAYPCYVGVKLQAGDIDQSDFLVGLAIQDTTAIVAVSDGLYFRSVDGAATVQFIAEKDSTETSAGSVVTMSDATDVTLEYYYDGSTVTAYVDGVEAASIADSDTNFPDDEELAPIIAFLTGEAVANTMQVAWFRAIQIRN